MTLWETQHGANVAEKSALALCDIANELHEMNELLRCLLGYMEQIAEKE